MVIVAVKARAEVRLYHLQIILNDGSCFEKLSTSSPIAYMLSHGGSALISRVELLGNFHEFRPLAVEKVWTENLQGFNLPLKNYEELPKVLPSGSLTEVEKQVREHCKFPLKKALEILSGESVDIEKGFWNTRAVGDEILVVYRINIDRQQHEISFLVDRSGTVIVSSAFPVLWR